MYLDFYNLKKAPFHITPDPEFLFLSPSHKAALGALVYGIEERQGFVALVGEVGLGKTTILRSYLERVDQMQLRAIYIFNSNVSFNDLLKTICREFGLEITTEDVFDTVNRLHQALIEEYKQGRNVALIVDEAQHMPIETLEHLRMLSNLETSTQKLIQIILVGQPEFEDKLNNHALRQLKQRLVIRATIAPLTEAESLEYIAYRLAKVSMIDEPIFTKGALRQIVKQAKGTPRVLNILCTNALIQGFGYRKPRIAARIAREVIADYLGKKPRRLWRPRLALAGTAALLATWFWFSPYPQVVLSRIDKDGFVKQTLANLMQSVAPAPAPAPAAPAPLPQETPVAPRDRVVPVERVVPADRVPPVAERPPTLPVEPIRREAPMPEMAAPSQTGPDTLYTVKQGDQIAKLAVEVYGVWSPAVREWIRKHNPDLRDVNRIEVGMQLTLPPLPASLR